jgi:N-acetylmuramoyl-L-alanine amidase
MTTMLDELDDAIEYEGGKSAPKICVDPGHGMSNSKAGVHDPGAARTVAGTTYTEAEIALRYGLALRQLLQRACAGVFMTRTTSAEAAPVATRAKRAADAGCTQFVSLHLNSNDDPQANGIEVLYRDDVKDKALAAAVLQAIVSATGLKNRGVKKRTDLAVLKFVPGPAVLIELAFISNAGDRNLLLDSAIQDRICAAIVKVVVTSPCGFFGRFFRRLNPAALL